MLWQTDIITEVLAMLLLLLGLDFLKSWFKKMNFHEILHKSTLHSFMEHGISELAAN